MSVGRRKTVYIAGPMTGLPQFNYPAFKQAEKALRALGYKVLNPTWAEKDNPTPGIPQAWDWYMRRALGMLVQADAVVALLPGWEASRGARLERSVATDLGMDIREIAGWLA